MDLKEKFLSSVYLFLEENGFSTHPISKEIVINGEEYVLNIFAYVDSVVINNSSWSNEKQVRFEIFFIENSILNSIETFKKLVTDIDIIVNKIYRRYPSKNTFNFSSSTLFLFQSYIGHRYVFLDISDI